MTTTPITKFEGEYRWLSNFWPCQIELDGIIYPSVEHAYQAAKSDDPIYRKKIENAIDPDFEKAAKKAKKLGKGITLKPGFEQHKLLLMTQFIQQKFKDPTLRAKLLNTGTQDLIEGNWWGDTFWGISKGDGKNHLGNILMELRDILRGV